MKMKQALLLCIAALALAGCSEGPAPAQTEGAFEASETYAADERSSDSQDGGGSPRDFAAEGGGDTPGDFDYYVLALSWSPTYCAQPESAERAPLQCASDRPFAFIVHGLWPQHERGWPRSCAPGDRGADVPEALKDDMLDLMPSPALIENQWDRHGTCTGQSQEAYFTATRRFREAIVIPQEFTRLTEPLRITGQAVEDAFLAANSDLSGDGVAVVCNRGRLREVRICLTKGGAPRACGGDVRDTCGEEAVTMPPVRPRRGG
jgi:ribonuclease T2